MTSTTDFYADEEELDARYYRRCAAFPLGTLDRLIVKEREALGLPYNRNYWD